jgi:uncharacterized membrane protein
MKLDINEIYHQYIIRIIIFGLFLYKQQIRQPNVYKLSVIAFVKKRLPWKINLVINTGARLSKEDERELILEEILYGVENDYMKSVVVIFTTPLKEVIMEIDLSDEDKYSKFFYS